MSHEHVDSVRTYILNFLALVALLVVTVAVSFVRLEPHFLNIAFAMLIATIKAVLVIIFFMGIRKTTKLTQVWAYGGIVFFLTLIFISLSDYFSRH